MRRNLSGFIHIVLIFVVVFIIGAALFFGKDKLKNVVSVGTPVSSAMQLPLSYTTPTTSRDKIICKTPTPIVNPKISWKKYINTKYGFQFEYPAEGVSQYGNLDGSCSATVVEECGNHIYENDSSVGHEISFDNFFAIGITTTKESIKDFIGPDLYPVLNLESVQNSNADEAFIVDGFKDGVDTSKLNSSPLSYFLLYKKGGYLITFNRNNGVLLGCFPPSIGEDKSYMDIFPEYTKLKWNVQDSFKFTQ